jgi:hypothetical protein
LGLSDETHAAKHPSRGGKLRSFGLNGLDLEGEFGGGWNGRVGEEGLEKGVG